MDSNYSGIFIISLVFGVISYIICSFIMDQQLSLILALFTFIVYFIAFFIYMKFYMKNVNKIDISDIDNICFKNMANYYRNGLAGNGILILTLERLIFIPTDNKKIPRVQFMLHEIEKVNYDKIYKHIKGIKVELKGGSTIGFVTSNYNKVLELLSLPKEHNFYKPTM